MCVCKPGYMSHMKFHCWLQSTPQYSLSNEAQESAAPLPEAQQQLPNDSVHSGNNSEHTPSMRADNSVLSGPGVLLQAPSPPAGNGTAAVAPSPPSHEQPTTQMNMVQRIVMLHSALLPHSALADTQLLEKAEACWRHVLQAPDASWDESIMLSEKHLRMACGHHAPQTIAYLLAVYVHLVLGKELNSIACRRRSVDELLTTEAPPLHPLRKRHSTRQATLDYVLAQNGLQCTSLAPSPTLSGGSLPQHRALVRALSTAAAAADTPPSYGQQSQWRMMTKRCGVLRPDLASGTLLDCASCNHSSALRRVCWRGDEGGLHLALGLMFAGQPLAALPWGKRGLLSHVPHVDGVNEGPGGYPWAREKRPPPDSDTMPRRRQRMLRLLLGITGPAACPPSVLAAHPALVPVWRAARWDGSAIRHGRRGAVLARRAARRAPAHTSS